MEQHDGFGANCSRGDGRPLDMTGRMGRSDRDTIRIDVTGLQLSRVGRQGSPLCAQEKCPQNNARDADNEPRRRMSIRNKVACEPEESRDTTDPEKEAMDWRAAGHHCSSGEAIHVPEFSLGRYACVFEPHEVAGQRQARASFR